MNVEQERKGIENRGLFLKETKTTTQCSVNKQSKNNVLHFP